MTVRTVDGSLLKITTWMRILLKMKVIILNHVNGFFVDFDEEYDDEGWSIEEG